MCNEGVEQVKYNNPPTLEAGAPQSIQDMDMVATLEGMLPGSLQHLSLAVSIDCYGLFLWAPQTKLPSLDLN